MQSEESGWPYTWRLRLSTGPRFVLGRSLYDGEYEFGDDLEFPEDGERIVGESTRYALAVPDPDPLPTVVDNHRAGTCFDVESTEMREACVESIDHHLGSDHVFHEVRHQRRGCHTDLVYAEIDADGLKKRFETTVGQDPLHDPLPRFKTWWYLRENGPKPREEAVENGKYSKPSKNRKHLDWLIEHGYVGTTAAGTVDAVVPPSIATLHAVELKLRDWEKALEQAAIANKADPDDFYTQLGKPRYTDRYGYADYRWVALDAGAIDAALANADRFREEGVGLLAVTEGGSVVEHVEPDHEPRRRYTRDRAYVESQVWTAVDLDDYSIETETDDSPQPSDQDQQQSLTTFGEGDA